MENKNNYILPLKISVLGMGIDRILLISVTLTGSIDLVL